MKQASWPLAKKTLGLYLRLNLSYKRLFFSSVGAWIGGMLLQKLVLPLIVASSFDTIRRLSSTGSISLSDFRGDIGLFVIVLIASQTLIDTGLFWNAKMEAQGLKELHDRVFAHLLRQSTRFHNNTLAGPLVSQTNRLVGGYVTITDTLLLNITQLVVLTAFSAIVLAFYSPLLAGVVFAWTIVFFYINIRLTRSRIALSKARAASESVLTGSLADSVSNISAIKSFGSESYEYERHAKVTEDRAYKGYVYWVRGAKNDAVFGIMMGIGQLLVLVTSIIAVTHGSISIGALVLAQIYI
ncbi:MAG: ABC transporter ATP-binding protein, partial [Candidatus Saccharibacteria bacterium]|nr:ABC transporter ATP-binding protein [Candidatus Saccharibacteria bacterium]